MGQMGAVLRSFGIRFGYYDPKNWREARYADPIVDTFGDMIGAVGKFAFAPDADKPAIMEALCSGIAHKMAKLADLNLRHHGGKFVAGNKVTIADFAMISFIENMMFNPLCPFAPRFQAYLTEFPKLKGYVMVARAEFKGHNAKRTLQTPF